LLPGFLAIHAVSDVNQWDNLPKPSEFSMLHRTPAMSRRNPYKGPDANTRRAKQKGYPARSVFKLEEIDRRARLFHQGMHVLDLGAAPGSWSLYAAEKIGERGKLLAVDKKPLEVTLPPSCTFVLGDATQTEALARYAPYDVVLSDMAPSTTGNRLGDQTRSYELFMFALATAVKVLRKGGAFVGKIFMGGDLPAARAEARKHFQSERLIRPEGTRSVSYEIFVVAQGKT
jgi:23S rRNA (uridine2552-2'-O)-methyltransferase